MRKDCFLSQSGWNISINSDQERPECVEICGFFEVQLHLQTRLNVMHCFTQTGWTQDIRYTNKIELYLESLALLQILPNLIATMFYKLRYLLEEMYMIYISSHKLSNKTQLKQKKEKRSVPYFRVLLNYKWQTTFYCAPLHHGFCEGFNSPE